MGDEMDLSAWARYWGDCKHSFVLLRTRVEVDDEVSHCLILDLYTSTIALIEDDDLAKALMRKMRSEGVRVLTREQIPVGISPFDRVHQDVANGVISTNEANRRLRNLGKDDEARRAWMRQHKL
jgi:hypothetical protein